MRKLGLVVLVVVAWSLIGAAGDTTRQVANGIAGVLVLASPFVLRVVRSTWPNLDGRIFSVGTWIVAAVITGIAVTISGEWRAIDFTSFTNFVTWATVLYGIQQLEYNLLKPQLQVAGAKN